MFSVAVVVLEVICYLGQDKKNVMYRNVMCSNFAAFFFHSNASRLHLISFPCFPSSLPSVATLPLWVGVIYRTERNGAGIGSILVCFELLTSSLLHPVMFVKLI